MKRRWPKFGSRSDPKIFSAEALTSYSTRLNSNSLRLGVVEHEAGARVVVARLAHRADADDVLPPGAQLELVGHHLVHAVRRERERLAEVRVADERQRRQVVPDLQALRRLIAREDVVELFDVERRAVAEVDVPLADLVRQVLQPLHVLGREQPGVHVQRVPGRVVVVRVVHPPRDRRVVVAEDGVRGLGSGSARSTRWGWRRTRPCRRGRSVGRPTRSSSALRTTSRASMLA